MAIYSKYYYAILNRIPSVQEDPVSSRDVGLISPNLLALSTRPGVFPLSDYLNADSAYEHTQNVKAGVRSQLACQYDFKCTTKWTESGFMYTLNMYLMQILMAAKGGAKKNNKHRKNHITTKQKITINVCSRKGLNRQR